MKESAILNDFEILELKIKDIYKLHIMFDSLSEESKLFFHPSFLGLKNINFRWVLSQILLMFSTVKFFRKLLLSAFKRFVIFSLIVKSRKSGEIVGYGYLAIKQALSKGYAAILGICVSDDFQGIGIGEKLIESLVKWARKENIKEISLRVLTINNRAISLYKKFGFKEDDKVYDWCMGKKCEAFIMKLRHEDNTSPV